MGSESLGGTQSSKSACKDRRRAGRQLAGGCGETPGGKSAPLLTARHAKGKLFSSWLNPSGSEEPRASRGRLGGGKHEHIFTEIGVSPQQQIP